MKIWDGIKRILYLWVPTVILCMVDFSIVSLLAGLWFGGFVMFNMHDQVNEILEKQGISFK